ncbi:hypothetical protein LWM68_08170 [Niabella sp. W65]|nr:hypothetical protein [Niabella sp. W65]MCH7362741.1 hypothetical protein [Niabella sp. W65]ULT38696.1 hypothetical protein KRR40_26845 [Niabella sp. I65]
MESLKHSTWALVVFCLGRSFVVLKKRKNEAKTGKAPFRSAFYFDSYEKSPLIVPLVCFPHPRMIPAD